MTVRFMSTVKALMSITVRVTHFLKRRKTTNHAVLTTVVRNSGSTTQAGFSH